MTDLHRIAALLHDALGLCASVHTADDYQEREGWMAVRAASAEADSCLATEPVTYAVAVCCYCRRFIGMRVWEGKQATDEHWCETGGICDSCAETVGEELTQRGERVEAAA